MTIQRTLLDYVNYHIYHALKLAEYTYAVEIDIERVVISSRMTRCLGRAKLYREKGVMKSEIAISSKVFKDEDSEALKDTVYHEVAHIVDAVLFGKMGHGTTWKNIMKALGREPNIYASKEKCASVGYAYTPRKNTRYLVVCFDCDKPYSITSQKLAKINSLRCKCGGKVYESY